MMTEVPREYLSVPEAAAMADVSQPTLWSWLRRGYIQRYKARGRTLVRATDMQRWLREYSAVKPADSETGAQNAAPEGTAE